MRTVLYCSSAIKKTQFPNCRTSHSHAEFCCHSRVLQRVTSPHSSSCNTLRPCWRRQVVPQKFFSVAKRCNQASGWTHLLTPMRPSYDYRQAKYVLYEYLQKWDSTCPHGVLKSARPPVICFFRILV